MRPLPPSSAVASGRLGRWAWALLAVVAACRQTPQVQPADVPADIAYVTLLVLDGGRVATGTPLTPWSPGEGLALVSRRDRASVVAGYTRSQLEAIGLDVGAAEQEAVRQAEGCESRLPAPAWYARWADDDRIDALPVTEAPPLTILATQVLCPDSGAPIAVDLPCGQPRCSPVIEPRGKCTLGLDLTECGLGRATATIQPDGGLCVAFSQETPQCRPRTPPSGAATAFHCGEPLGCDVDFYRGDTASDQAPYTLDRITLREGEPYYDRSASGGLIVLGRGRWEGYLQDFVVLEDTVVVSGDPAGAGGAGCAVWKPRESALFIVDRESMTLTGTVAAPACTHQMVPDPSSAGFLATHADLTQHGWHLSRFAADGSIVETLRLDTDEEDAAGQRIENLYQLVVLPELGRVAITHSWRDKSQSPEGESVKRIDTIDITRLERVTRQDVQQPPETIPHFDMRPAIAFGGRFLALSQDAEALVILDPSTGRPVEELELIEGRGRGLHESTFDFLEHRGSARVLIAGVGPNELYSADAASDIVQRRSVWEHHTALMTVDEWPPDRNTVLGTALLWGPWDAVSVFIDPRQMRILPGMRRLGHGMVGRVREDDAGRLWMLLPWAGELVRLTPR